MMRDAPLFPEQASTIASQIDNLFFFALGIAAFFSILIALLIVTLGVRYRRRHAAQVGEAPPHDSKATTVLEITWSVIPFGILMIMFIWGAKIYFTAARPPADAIQFYVVGKQWMWKVQHPEGRREINEMHVPVGRPIKLLMTSEDVIHSFFIPAFRIKQDVLPGRYTSMWFQADKVGTYHLFCSQYCGAEHAKMGGWVVVMEPHEYQAWLAGEVTGQPAYMSGADLFAARACNTCHRPDTSARAPILTGLFGKQVALQDGRRVAADEAYIRESIIEPQAKIVTGYQPIMPTFKGQLTEEDVIELINYIRGLKAPEGVRR
jgi:cytochrome c oxidase subunit 2